MHPPAPPPEPLRPRIGRLTLVFLAVVAGGLALGIGLRPTDPIEPKPADTGSLVGMPAPEASVTMFDGTTWWLGRHLADDGRPLVLNLWASWCVPCRAEIPELSSFAGAHPEVAVIGVAVEDEETDARRLATELAPAYPVGIDATGRLPERYSIFGLPTTFVIGPDGIVTHQLAGGVTSDSLESLLG